MGLFGKSGGGNKSKNKKGNQADLESQENQEQEQEDPKNTNGKKKKNKKGKKVKEPKGKQKKNKKGKKSGKKKDMTLLERMQLEESVAAASLDVVQELADLGDSAVREVEDGLLIVAFTNDMLEEAELDPSSEEFGSFAEALRSETIESIALADDLASGVVGIIPSQETLISLDEFDFVHETAFRWAIVPFDLSDDDRLTLLDGDVHIERLVEMSNDAGIQLAVKNGEVVEVGSDNQDDYDTDDFGDTDDFDDGVIEDDGLDGLDDDDDLDDFDESEPEQALDTDGFDDSLDDDFDTGFDDNADDNLDDFEPESNDNVDEFDELASDDYANESEVIEDDMNDFETVTDIDDGATAEESKEAINRVVNHSFNNTELDLNIDMNKFDDYFDSITIAQFDAARQDDSELHNILSKLRQDANVELSRFHQDNVQSLRNKFTTSMRDIHNKLVESLDHKDQHTTYGTRYYEIESEYDDAIDDLERTVAGEVKKITNDYNEKREEYAENAKREAFAVYDSRYRDERDRKVESTKDVIQSELKTSRDTNLGELYSDRRTVAQRLFDKATTALLQKLQEEYQNISQNELQMYDAFRKDMDVYLRKHFADEVLRSKAEAEKLKQSHEAERVRREYEQMLMTKARQIEEQDTQARDNIRQLDGTHKEQVERVKADYDRRIEREQRDNKELRQMLQESNNSNSKIGEQKEKEIEHRMKLYENTIKAKDLELEYANQRAERSQKPMKFIMGASVAVALALGIIAGFLFGAGQTNQMAPAAPEQQQQNQVVSFNSDAMSSELAMRSVIDFEKFEFERDSVA